MEPYEWKQQKERAKDIILNWKYVMPLDSKKKKKHAGVNAVDVKMTHWDESPNTEAISSRIPDTIVK